MGEFYFSPYQIAEMAMTVEEEGARFYMALAGLIDGEKIKNIFLFLSKAELEHRDTFRSIAATLHKEDFNEYSVDVKMLMQTHLNKLKRLAFNMRIAREKQLGIPETIDIAINTEKEAIKIYSQMYRAFIEKFHEVLLAIIKEEKKHLEMLNKVKRTKINLDK
jgi:rubrerythrin